MADPAATFYTPSTSYPGGVALSKDGKSAYALLNQNDTLTKINLTAKPPKQGAQIRVGNAPHSIVINSTGTTAYVSNEGGRAATEADFQIYSAGTEIVADPVVGAAITGTVSVVDLATMKVTATISTGLHPTGMALYGRSLLVANTYSDTISIIDTATNKVARTIPPWAADRSARRRPTGLWRRAELDRRRWQERRCLRRALQCQRDRGGQPQQRRATNPVMGMIPVAYAPSSVVLDEADNVLIVANDKGIGTRYSFETDYGVSGYNTHQDNGTVSIVPVPNSGTLEAMTKQVFENNHWDLTQNIQSAAGGKPSTKPVAIPDKIGDPSLIKHVFLIVRENRTYDQILGDVAAGNGDPSLAVFGGKDTPNAHRAGEALPSLRQFLRPEPPVG